MPAHLRRAVAVVAALVLAACSSADAPTAVPATAPEPATGSTTTSSPASTAPALAPSAPAAEPEEVPGGLPPATEPSTTPPVVTQQPVDTPPVVTEPPATGVPAGAGSDAFCAEYGALAVSVYLVGLVEAFAGDPLQARRVEVVAAHAIAGAFERATAALPAALAPDAAAFATRWAPYAARAGRALAGLTGAGMTEDAFAARWRAIVATHDRNDPALELGLDATTAAALEPVVGAFAAEVGSLADDGAVGQAAATPAPLLDAYVVEHCPDVAAVAVADAV